MVQIEPIALDPVGSLAIRTRVDKVTEILLVDEGWGADCLAGAPASCSGERLLGARERALSGLDLEVDLLAVHGDASGRLDAQPHFRAVARQHGELDVVADHDCLSDLPRQDEHVSHFPGRLDIPASFRRLKGSDDLITARLQVG